MSEAKISSKGQITLPSSIRRKLGIDAGDILLVRESGDSSVVLEISKKEMKAGSAALKAIAASKGIWKDRSDFNNEELRRMREMDIKRLDDLYNE